MKSKRGSSAIPHAHLSTMALLQKQYETQLRQLAFRARTLGEWRTWRDALRLRLSESLGGFPMVRYELNVQVAEVVEEKNYRREKIFFYSEPSAAVPCYVLIPKKVSPPYRPVIVLHGHGSGGARLLLGKPRGKTERAQLKAYNYNYAQQLAEQGYMVFLPVQRALGERVEKDKPFRTQTGANEKSCEMITNVSLLFGRTLLGMRVWDVKRTIDYIHTRPEPMVEGIGCVGFSGGGTTALYAAALDERLDPVVIDGAFCSYRSSIMSVPHCSDNYVPGILRYAEIADVAGLIAPRALLIEHGTRDPIFPIEGVREAYQDLGRTYALLESSDRLCADFFPGAHRFSGRKAFDWLDHWLK